MAFAAAGMSYDKLPMTHTKIVAAMWRFGVICNFSKGYIIFITYNDQIWKERPNLSPKNFKFLNISKEDKIKLVIYFCKL
jgi:hypothetical protein